MTIPSRRRTAGFSLVELLIALLVSVVILMGATALLRGQQAAFRVTSAERVVQEGGRIALDHVASGLRMAGFGVDPALAFDFGPQAAARMDRAPTGTTFAATSLSCGTGVSCRDRTDGPDEIVFLSRDPFFGHALRFRVNDSSSSLTIQGPLAQPLHQGQILLVMCYSGPMRWAYLTVSQEVAATTDPSAVVDVPIQSASGGTFPTQNGFLSSTSAQGCFDTVSDGTAGSLASAAKVFKIDRHRYFIRSFAADGTVVPWGTAGSRPWLMLDGGLTAADGSAIVEPLVPDVEDLQLAYVFANDTPATVVGATAGTAIASGSSGIDLSASPPVYSDEGAATSRRTHHPANIRAVRIAVVTRGAEQDLSLPNASTLPAALNRAARAAEAGHRRQIFETTVQVRNLDTRAPYFPTWEPGSATLNVGGG